MHFGVVMASSIFFFCLFLPSTKAAAWPSVPHGVAQMPALELSLAPPLQPLPELSTIIGNAERSRDMLEAKMMAKLQPAVKAALADAKKRIGNAVGRLMSVFDDPAVLRALGSARGAFLKAKRLPTPTLFLESRQSNLIGDGVAGGDRYRVKVNVVADAKLPDPFVKSAVDAMEQTASEREKASFAQVISDMSSITDMVVNELEASSQNYVNLLLGGSSLRQTAGRIATSFLSSSAGGLPNQVPVRVVANDIPYPTTASMVQDMESRRDISENLERVQMLKILVDLCRSENELVAEALGSAMDRIKAQYEKAVR